MTRTVILDTEAVDALGDPRHRHHRQVLAVAKVVAGRKRKAVAAIRFTVPTCVRVEACWDREAPTAASLNRFRITDLALDPGAASAAAAIRKQHGVSVADAHIGAVIGHLDGDVTVVTSDPDDIRAVAGGRSVTVVTL